jgi:hypothetical protein
MRKIKEVLRLHSLGRKQREIARSCSISQSTVHEYLKAADAAGKSWPEIADWDEVQLEKELSSQRPAPHPAFCALDSRFCQHPPRVAEPVGQETETN